MSHEIISKRSHVDIINFFVSRTSDYKDEMAVGAGMLYLATNNSQYLTDAESFHQHGNQWGQSWENKYTASMVGIYIYRYQFYVIIKLID